MPTDGRTKNELLEYLDGIPYGHCAPASLFTGDELLALEELREAGEVQGGVFQWGRAAYWRSGHWRVSI